MRQPGRSRPVQGGADFRDAVEGFHQRIRRRAPVAIGGQDGEVRLADAGQKALAPANRRVERRPGRSRLRGVDVEHGDFHGGRLGVGERGAGGDQRVAGGFDPLPDIAGRFVLCGETGGERFLACRFTPPPGRRDGFERVEEEVGLECLAAGGHQGERGAGAAMAQRASPAPLAGLLERLSRFKEVRGAAARSDQRRREDQAQGFGRGAPGAEHGVERVPGLEALFDQRLDILGGAEGGEGGVADIGFVGAMGAGPEGRVEGAKALIDGVRHGFGPIWNVPRLNDETGRIAAGEGSALAFSRPRANFPAMPDAALDLLPAPLADWFARRGWTPRPHQLDMLRADRVGRDALLIAPTGGGKTLGGFLPSLVELEQIAREGGPHRPHRLHTIYVSPLKALSVDVARNLIGPAEEMGLDLRIETRTGDTSQGKRQRQRAHPPDILLTTPEQIALFCATANAERFFRDLRRIVIDEAHALAPSKRGDLLALGLSALARWAPEARRAGLSATVADEGGLARWLTAQTGDGAAARIIRGEGGARPVVEILDSVERIPWAGHTGRHAMTEVYGRIKQAGMALVFVNTRAQAEMTFQELWRLNDDNLPIALHHGSLSPEQRRKVEAAMASGKLKAVVCTSTLDLGIDWGDVDLVIQMGAPKGSSRLIQRLGRSNHRLDSPSRALLAPTNRFEHLECETARDAVAENALDGEPLTAGSLDVLAQHLMGRACGEPVSADDLFEEIRSAAPYAHLDRETFDRVFDFTATGGYALNTYDRFRRLVKSRDGLWRARSPQIAQRHRLNVGAIVEAPMLDVRYARRGGRRLGQIEEWFVDQLSPGDTFVFAGQILAFEGIDEAAALVSPSKAEEPKVPSYQGGKFPISTYLAKRVRELVQSPERWDRLPGQVQEWLRLQQARSMLPPAEGLLVETYPRGGKYYLCCYPFEGRLAHQTLGMLVTRRLERMRLRPMGFVANEYALAVWGLRDLSAVDFDALFHEDMLGDDLDAWLDESDLMKRTFRNCAVISGLIERRFPGQEKTGRQVNFSTDLIYDVLRSHEPDHILLQAARADAATGLLDIRRLGQALSRVKHRIVHNPLDRISPLAVPVMLEVGKEPVYGEGHESILADASVDASEALIEEAMRLD